MTKSKKNRGGNSSNRNNKQFLMHTVVGFVACILGSGIIAFMSTTTSVQNLATTMPHGSTMMMDQMAGRSASYHPAGNHKSGAHVMPSQGSNGLMFADARSTDAARQQKEAQSQTPSKHAHESNERSNNMNSRSDHVRYDHGKFSKRKYNYYYYDSNSQAFHLHDEYTVYPVKPVSHPSSQFQAALSLSGRYQPTLCSDGQTMGFSDLSKLRNAIRELNDAYTQAVSRWEHYNSALAEYKAIKINHQHDTASGEVDIEAPPQLPEHMMIILQTEPDPFIICPHTTLRGSSLYGRHMPIYIDAEDVVVECDTCVLDTPGTHFSFGPYAKNVLVKGVTMMGATESSIIFRHNGAEVSFEDCYWVNNASVGMHGSVADVNSTSTVKFYRCEVSDVKQSSRTGTYSPNHVSSSLTLRG